MKILHARKLVHRDLKPDNIVIGNSLNKETLFLIDFGLTKKYLDSKGKHIEKKQKPGLVGTARYASINSHLGLE